MLIKMGYRDLKRNPFMYVLIAGLLAVAYVAVLSVTSAVEVKFQKYSALSGYIEQDGYFIHAMNLTVPIDPAQGQGYARLLRDEQEIKEQLPKVQDVLCAEWLWGPMIKENPEETVNVWCYSSGVVQALSPELQEGRWFRETDMDKETLQAVVVCSDGLWHVGDRLTLESGMSPNAQVELEIIGVLEDGQDLYSASSEGELHGDYRDCYYTYNTKVEEAPLILLADEQIARGEEKGLFAPLNYRIATEQTGGFQKQMSGSALITFAKGTQQEEKKAELQTLTETSQIEKVWKLRTFCDSSWEYIFQELSYYLPMFVCVFAFILIAAISANAVTVKRQMHNYAIYYICGLSWRKCAQISLGASGLVSGGVLLMVVIGTGILQMTGRLKETALHLGGWQLFAGLVLMLCYVLLAWLVPMGIVRRSSAKEILIKHQ